MSPSSPWSITWSPSTTYNIIIRFILIQHQSHTTTCSYPITLSGMYIQLTPQINMVKKKFYSQGQISIFCYFVEQARAAQELQGACYSNDLDSMSWLNSLVMVEQKKRKIYCFVVEYSSTDIAWTDITILIYALLKLYWEDKTTGTMMRDFTVFAVNEVNTISRSSLVTGGQCTYSVDWYHPLQNLTIQRTVETTTH